MHLRVLEMKSGSFLFPTRMKHCKFYLSEFVSVDFTGVE